MEITYFIGKEVTTMSKEDQQVQLHNYFNRVVGLIQGSIFSGQEKADIKIKINVSNMIEQLPPLDLNVEKILKEKGMILSVVDISNGDGVFYK